MTFIRQSDNSSQTTCLTLYCHTGNNNSAEGCVIIHTGVCTRIRRSVWNMQNTFIFLTYIVTFSVNTRDIIIITFNGLYSFLQLFVEMVCLCRRFSAAACGVFSMKDSHKHTNEKAGRSCSGNTEAVMGAGPRYLTDCDCEWVSSLRKTKWETVVTPSLVVLDDTDTAIKRTMEKYRSFMKNICCAGCVYS